MNDDRSVDLYEVLEVSRNAGQDTIERVFRYLAQRHHPDRNGEEHAERFGEIVRAYATLKDPEKRAAYDASHSRNADQAWSVLEEAMDSDGFERDRQIQERVLSLLYTQRKRDMREPGFGAFELERATGCPQEMLEFHLWYLREKGWIGRTESGLLAITADGVDQTLTVHHRRHRQRRITQDS